VFLWGLLLTDMAEGKNKVIVYRDWGTTFEALTDDVAGRLIKHFFKYINDENPEAPDRITGLLFEPIKRQLKRDLKAYEAMCLRNRNNGSKGGRPAQTDGNPLEPTGLVPNPLEPDTDKDTDKDNDINISFDVFWNAYDKKVGNKKLCIQRWNKLKDAERQKIIDTLPMFIASIRDRQFLPYPEKYLNQRR